MRTFVAPGRNSRGLSWWGLMDCPSAELFDPSQPLSRSQVPTPQIEWLGSVPIGLGNPTVGSPVEIGPD
jgi:hypothetical protein